MSWHSPFLASPVSFSIPTVTAVSVASSVTLPSSV